MPAGQAMNWGEAERPGGGKAGSALWVIAGVVCTAGIACMAGIAGIVGWGERHVRRLSRHLLSRYSLSTGSATQLWLLLILSLFLLLLLLLLLVILVLLMMLWFTLSFCFYFSP